VTIDLGRVVNVAGMSVVFSHIPESSLFKWSEDGERFFDITLLTGNRETSITVPSLATHVRTRHVQLIMQIPIDLIDHPDQPNWQLGMQPVFSIREWRIMEHTGGAGVFGIQSLDGRQHNTIAYGLLQPGEWVLSSEGQNREADRQFTQWLVDAPSYNDVGRAVHLTATFQKVTSPIPSLRLTRIALYRNGQALGEPYLAAGPLDRLSEPGQTRLVFGTRSTAYAPENDPRPDFAHPGGGARHGFTHSAFFQGMIFNASLIRNALSPEEVLNIYNAHRGGQEMGCHCYNACPPGVNRFFPSVPIPCSGQGACMRNPNGQPFAAGTCLCLAGFSGEACEDHCSSLSESGCCEVDDDCPAGVACNQERKACMT